VACKDEFHYLFGVPREIKNPVHLFPHCNEAILAIFRLKCSIDKAVFTRFDLGNFFLNVP